jgi:hypothetical protein
MAPHVQAVANETAHIPAFLILSLGAAGVARLGSGSQAHAGRYQRGKQSMHVTHDDVILRHSCQATRLC